MLQLKPKFDLRSDVVCDILRKEASVCRVKEYSGEVDTRLLNIERGGILYSWKRVDFCRRGAPNCIKHVRRELKRNNMGKVGRCLKRSYIIVASFVAIISGLLLAITLFTHGYFQEDEELEKFISGLHAMYVISIITLILTIFGVYGACKKKQWALILFTVGIILSSLFMITCEIQGLAVQPQMAKELKKQYLHMLPLDNATEAFVDGLKDVQMELQCCGLDQGYLDWGHDIPESCLCTEETTNPCVAAPRDSSLFEHMGDDQPIMIYKESCLPYLIEHEMITLNTALGIMLGVTLLWILSVVLCIAILCQLSRKEDTPTVVYSSEAKAGNYTALADAAEYT